MLVGAVFGAKVLSHRSRSVADRITDAEIEGALDVALGRNRDWFRQR